MPKPKMPKQNYEEFSQDEFISPDEAQAKIIQMLLKVTSPSIMTELTEKEVKNIAQLKTIADIYDSNSLRVLIENYMLLKISYKRQGRKEIIGVAKPSEGQNDKMKKTLKSMVLGLK